MAGSITKPGIIWQERTAARDHIRHQDKSDTTTRRFYEHIIVLYAPQAQERKEIIIKTESVGFTFFRRIGNTNYKVKVHFDPDASDTMEEKIIRMISNEGMAIGENCDIMDLPQMSRQSERSA